MAELFSVQFVGAEGHGLAALCIGGGKVIGFDGGNGRYTGSYHDEGGRVRGRLSLTYNDEWPLVTGNRFKPGDVVELVFDWPSDFTKGEQQQAFINGQPITVKFTLIGEVP